MHDLIERYLHAVKFWLPRTGQQDILAELAEDLHSQAQEREEELGHPLEEADLVEIVKRRGAPLKVASSYMTETRLLNPAMFAVYRLVLKIVLLWVLLPIFVIVFIGPIFSSPDPAAIAGRFLFEALRAGFTTVGIVTTVFYLLDRYQVRAASFEQWDPRKLPRVPRSYDASDRQKAFGNALAALAAAAFWAVMMWHRTAFHFGNAQAILAPIWREVYWLVLLLTLADGLVEAFGFINPAAVKVRAQIRLGLALVSIVVVVVLLRVDSWITLADTGLAPAALAKAMTWANAIVEINLLAVILIKAIDGITQIRKLVRRKPSNHAPILTVS